MKKSLDSKGRWRNRLVGFRVSEEEAELSGLSKQDYILRKLLNWQVVVQGNPKVYKALKKELNCVLDELKRLEVCSDQNEELLQTIQIISLTLNDMKEEA